MTPVTQVPDLLQKANPRLPILSLDDPAFSDFGQVFRDLKYPDLVEAALRQFPFKEGTSYTASAPELESTEGFRQIQSRLFAELPLQAGLCWGENTRLNGMEYHKSSEIIVAATEMVLLLGKLQDVTETGWSSEKGMAFHVPAGAVLELYATTLHLAPCRAGADPFYAVIILPRGTNTPLEGKPEGYLWMKNKWLLAHPEGPAAARGAALGITGVNLQVFPAEREYQS
jgi:hypothetical protein